MKKSIFAAMVLVAATTASAQSYEDLRIYINPGHGSWTANDRPMTVIGKPEYSSTNTDTTGFFESNTDLYKGFGMLEELIEMGFPFDRTKNQTGERWEIGAARDLEQNVVMSRVKNGPYSTSNTSSSSGATLYNRNLFDICCEVEYNNFDMFVSIHSNAASSDGPITNYHLLEYRGETADKNCYAEGSYEMCEAALKYSYANIHHGWSQKDPYIYGDVTFNGHGSGSENSLGYYGWLGVLKHGTPGYLVEGFFHTYQPARHRAMNFDVDIEEGCAYARGVAEYFELEQAPTGDIYGIVRDTHKKFKHDLYKYNNNTLDNRMPLNGVKVYLHKDGKVVKEYTTDQFYNGAFVFFNLNPGKYTITFEHPDYKNAEPVEVEVVSGDCVYPICYLENVNYILPGKHEVIYPDEAAGVIAPKDSYTLTQTYVDEPLAQLAGKEVRRVIARGDRVYVLAVDEANAPTIVVYDARQKTVVAEVNTDGCTGSVMNIADIQLTGDNYLVASAKTLLHLSENYVAAGEKQGTLMFYRWAKDENNLPTGAPIAWIETQNSGSWETAYSGETFAFNGNYIEGRITYAAETTLDTHRIRTVSITVSNSDNEAEIVSKPSSAVYSTDVLGKDYQFTISPIDGDKYYFVSGSGSEYGVMQFDHAHRQSGKASAEMPAGLIDNTVSRIAFLRSCGKAYMVAPGESTVRMFDVTEGINKAAEVALTNAAVPATSAQNVAVAAAGIVTRDASEAITDADIVIYLIRDGKITRFTTEDPAGVGSVSMDAANAPVEFFNLQGVRIDSNSLPSGIYIRRCGNRADKVIVK